MNNNDKPWWMPDVNGFLAGAIVLICAIALFYRMSRPSVIDDKMLETMLTILFSTCLVSVYNYSYGSSRGSQAKDETQNKIVEKLATNTNVPVVAPGTVVTTTTPETVITTTTPEKKTEWK